jgi:hypothetical protein
VRNAQGQERGATTSSTGDAPQQDHRSDKSSLTGQFGGIVHNQTANVSAEFGIVGLDQHGTLAGCMVVQQPLFGSGPFEGFISDPDVTFIVTSAIGKITFQGTRRNASINARPPGRPSSSSRIFPLRTVTFSPTPYPHKSFSCNT